MSVNSRRKAELKGGVAPWTAVAETRPGQNSAANDVLAEPILKAFFSKEELAAELGRNPRKLDRWEMLGTGPTDLLWSHCALSAKKRANMARRARTVLPSAAIHQHS